MSPNHGARSGEGHAVHIDIDVAERLLKASALHAQGSLTDDEFVELREHIMTHRPDPGAGATA